MKLKIKQTQTRAFIAILKQLIRGEALLKKNLLPGNELLQKTEVAIGNSLFNLGFLGYPSELLEELHTNYCFDSLMKELGMTRGKKVQVKSQETFCQMFADNLRLLGRIQPMIFGLYPTKRKSFQRSTDDVLNQAVVAIEMLYGDHGGIFIDSGEPTVFEFASAIEKAPEVIAKAKEMRESTKTFNDLMRNLTEGSFLGALIMKGLLDGTFAAVSESCPGCPACRGTETKPGPAPTTPTQTRPEQAVS